jgi:hypothetical protein
LAALLASGNLMILAARKICASWLHLAKGCCPTNAHASQFPRAGNWLGCKQTAPLRDIGGAVGVGILSAIKAALLIEMTLDPKRGRTRIFAMKMAPRFVDALLGNFGSKEDEISANKFTDEVGRDGRQLQPSVDELASRAVE